MLEFVEGDPLIPPEPTSGYARPRGDGGLTLLVLVFRSYEAGHRNVRGRRSVVVARRNDKAWLSHLPAGDNCTVCTGTSIFRVSLQVPAIDRALVVGNQRG